METQLDLVLQLTQGIICTTYLSNLGQEDIPPKKIKCNSSTKFSKFCENISKTSLLCSYSIYLSRNDSWSRTALLIATSLYSRNFIILYVTSSSVGLLILFICEFNLLINNKLILSVTKDKFLILCTKCLPTQSLLCHIIIISLEDF